MLNFVSRFLVNNAIFSQSKIVFPNCVVTKYALFNTSAIVNKGEDRSMMLRSMPKKDEGVQGEHSMDIDYRGYQSICEFPDEDTPNRLFDGVPFKDIPILYIRVTKNNTHLTLADVKGIQIEYNSCGREGFKNCRKGTNVAAQATAISISKKILKKGIKTVRVMIRGLGPGRMSSIKGCQLGGLNIVAICDATSAPRLPRSRPQAARSV